jgi:restriction endonuclease S subunit
MTSLPPGWRMITVAEAGQLDLGRQRHPDWHTGPNMRPYLRVANVFEDRIDVSDLKEMDFSGVFERYRLEPGDVLLNEGQSPEWLGRPAIYRGNPPNVAFTNTLIRFRANPDVMPEWALIVFRSHMHTGRFAREARITTNIAHLSLSRLKGVEFPLPPLHEQKRIVEILEDHLSRLDAGLTGIETATTRLDALTAAYLAVLAPTSLPTGWQMTTIGSIASVIRNGIFASRPSNDDSGVPILRISAVRSGAVDLADRKYVTGVDQATIDRYALVSGDLLFTRYNGSRRLVARCGVVPEHGGPILHPDKLIRVAVSPEVAESRFIAYQMETLRVRAYFEPLIRTTAGQSGVSGADVRGAPVALAPLDEQRRLVQLTEDRLVEIRRLRGQLARGRHAQEVLRRALLRAAFAGRLTERTNTVEELVGV